MADTRGNNSDNKGMDKESRKGTLPENRGNHKLRDNDSNSNESISTAGDTSNPKYSKTNMRKDEKERRDNSDYTG